MADNLDNLKVQLAKDRQIILSVRVTAGAKVERIIGLMTDGTLKVAIAKAPEKGQANNALCRLLSEEFQTDKKAVMIIKGQSSPHKVIKIVI